MLLDLGRTSAAGLAGFRWRVSVSTLSVAERVHISTVTFPHRFDAAPAIPTTRTPAIPISRLNHTAFALAVYASCRGFPSTSKTRFRLAANLYRVGLFTHRDILKGFTTMAPCCSPLPGLCMARRNRGLQAIVSKLKGKKLNTINNLMRRTYALAIQPYARSLREHESGDQ